VKGIALDYSTLNYLHVLDQPQIEADATPTAIRRDTRPASGKWFSTILAISFRVVRTGRWLGFSTGRRVEAKGDRFFLDPSFPIAL